MTTNSGKKANEEANEADHNSRHPEPLTAQDSRSNHKTVWTVTEDEELFKKYSIRAVVQTVLPDAVLWDKLAARDPDLKELKSAIAREYFTIPERNVLRPQFNPVFAELAVVGGLVLRGSRIVVPRSLEDKVVRLACEGNKKVTKTKEYLRTRVWFPGLDQMVEANNYSALPPMPGGDTSV